MINLPDKNKLLRNFSSYGTWEEKYLYIIELGEQLPPLSIEMRIQANMITDCQSQVWIALLTNDNSIVQLYGDSDAAIVKGLIAIIFVFYSGLTLEKVLTYNIRSFLDALELTQHLTPYRSQGLEAIIRSIRAKAAAWLKPQVPISLDLSYT